MSGVLYVQTLLTYRELAPYSQFASDFDEQLLFVSLNSVRSVYCENCL